MKAKGIILTVLSAVIYGFTPILGRLTYSMGSNGFTLSFYRYIFSIPVLLLFALTRERKKVERRHVKNIFLVSLGLSLTTILLYSSYSYIGVGTATTIHYLYPLCISLSVTLLFHKKMERPQLICLICCTLGIGSFIERNMMDSSMGLILSFLSSLTFAFYMISYEELHCGLLPPFAMNVILSVFVAVEIGVPGMMAGQIVLALPLKAHIYNVIIAVLTSVIASLFLQQGIKCLGASMAAVFSMLEPVTSVLFGFMILGESLSVKKVAGCIVILGGITYLILYNGKRQRELEAQSGAAAGD